LPAIKEVRVPEHADRLSRLDVSFLYLENPATAMHVGTVMIFKPAKGGLSLDRLSRHISSRINQVPRYRQRLRQVPGRLANPIWVDDEEFDLSYHVRRSAVPKPGNADQLAELVARLQSRPLDRQRPLWELYVVEGLADGHFALISKVHQALVDGVHTVDLSQVILDHEPNLEPVAQLPWTPAPGPNTAQLVVDAVTDVIARPGELVDVVRHGLADVRDTAATTAKAAARVAGLARGLTGAAQPSPLSGADTPHRRFEMVQTDLDDYRTIRLAMATPRSGKRRVVNPLVVTVNDVILAVLAGALRAWLLTRGEPVKPGSIVRTLVPMSVRGEVAEAGDGGPPAMEVGTRVESFLLDLPTGEASPLMRVHQVAYQTRAHRDTGQAVDAAALAGMAGFAPPTLHSLGARVAAGLSRRMFHLMVTNVPGPQETLYADGAELVSTYPVVPVPAGQSMSIGLTSYAGKIYYGLNAEREAMPDLAVVGHCIQDSLAELLEAVR
jgi:WS/DGAT/MGAT family acyltransferase